MVCGGVRKLITKGTFPRENEFGEICSCFIFKNIEERRVGKFVEMSFCYFPLPMSLKIYDVISTLHGGILYSNVSELIAKYNRNRHSVYCKSTYFREPIVIEKI